MISPTFQNPYLSYSNSAYAFFCFQKSVTAGVVMHNLLHVSFFPFSYPVYKTAGSANEVCCWTGMQSVYVYFSFPHDKKRGHDTPFYEHGGMLCNGARMMKWPASERAHQMSNVNEMYGKRNIRQLETNDSLWYTPFHIIGEQWNIEFTPKNFLISKSLWVGFKASSAERTVILECTI